MRAGDVDHQANGGCHAGTRSECRRRVKGIREQSQADRHAAEACVEQRLAPCPIDEHKRNNSGKHVRNRHQQRGEDCIPVRCNACQSEYLRSVVNDRVNAGHLLQHGEPHRNQERSADGRTPQFAPALFDLYGKRRANFLDQRLRTCLVGITAQHRLHFTHAILREEQRGLSGAWRQAAKTVLRAERRVQTSSAMRAALPARNP